MQLAPSQSIDRYTVLRRLGAGGMAEVWLVRHDPLQSLHALKVLTHRTPGLHQRLLREGRLQGGIGHPGVVTVTDVIDVDGAPGLVMEYVAGPSLEAVLKHRRLSLTEVDAIAREVLDAIAAAHARGWIHRDLKPGNILIDLRGERARPRVSDFGLAKALVPEGGPSSAATRAGTTMGTPAYMAPEQIRDSATVDARADVFSLGAVLYELVTGQQPFTGSDTLELLNAVAQGRRPPVAQCAPRLPRRMVDAIERALAVSPIDRFADAAELRAAWVDGTESEPEPTLPSEPLRAVGAAQPAPTTAEEFASSLAGDLTWAPASAASIASSPSTHTPRPAPTPPRVAPSQRHQARRVAAAAFVLVTGLALLARFVVWPTGAYPAASATLVGDRLVVAGEVSPRNAAPRVMVQQVGGRITSVAGVTAHGGPWEILGTTEVISLSVVRDPAGEITGYEARDAYDNLLHAVRLDRDGDTVRARHLGPEGAPEGSPWPLAGLPDLEASRVTVERLERPSANLLRVHFETSTGQPSPAADGTWGAELTLDDAGRVRARTPLDATGAQVMAQGVARVRYLSDDRRFPDAITRIRREAEGGAPAAGPGGWAERVTTLDDQGMAIHVAWLNAIGRPTWGDDGCHAVRRDTTLGRATRTCLDADGEPGPSSTGWTVFERTLDERGYAHTTRTMDASGALVAGHGRAASWSARFSPRGDLLQRGPFHDPDGALVPNPYGDYWIIQFGYDERGNNVSTAYTDPEGRPVQGPSGVEVIRKTFTATGRPLAEMGFHADGRPARTHGGAHRVTNTYDAQGMVVGVEYTDAEGHPVAGDGLIATRRWERDADGRQLEARSYGADGQLVVDPDASAARLILLRDEAGSVVGVNHLGPDEQPMPGPNGCPRERFVLAGPELRAEVACQDADGQPMENDAGWSLARSTFDAEGRDLSVRFFDRTGSPIAGCANNIFEYDARGRLIYDRCFDGAGEPTPQDGAAAVSIRYEVDELDRIVSTRWLDAAGRPAEGTIHGVATTIVRYRGASKDVEERSYVDPAGDLFAVDGGYARAVYTFDSWGRTVGVAYFGADNRPAIRPSAGYASATMTYDTHGRVAREEHRDVDGQPFAPPRAAVLTYGYDPLGRLDTTTCTTPTGAAARCPEGFHTRRCVRGEDGTCLRWADADITGAPLPGG